MPYFIADDCVDVKDKSCMEECPVDCIYEGERKLYINPIECIDCGACLPVCPVESIGVVRYADESKKSMANDNKVFFELVLPGRAEPLGTPGGAASTGAIGADTPFIANLPTKQ